MADTAIVAGPDPDGLGDALEAEGLDSARSDGQVSTDALVAAGVDTARLLVLTDTAEATGVALAKSENPAIRAVFYCRQSIPAFAAGQTDLAVDPELLDVRVVAEELATE